MKNIKGVLLSVVSLLIVYVMICFFAPRSFISDTDIDTELLKNKKKTKKQIPFFKRGFYLFRYKEKKEE